MSELEILQCLDDQDYGEIKALSEVECRHVPLRVVDELSVEIVALRAQVERLESVIRQTPSINAMQRIADLEQQLADSRTECAMLHSDIQQRADPGDGVYYANAMNWAHIWKNKAEDLEQQLERARERLDGQTTYSASLQKIITALIERRADLLPQRNEAPFHFDKAAEALEATGSPGRSGEQGGD